MTPMSDPVRVLLIDEDPEVLDITETFLERADEGLDVTSVQRVTAALDSLDDDEFDCVVSDYKMPKMDGLTLFEEVRDRDADIPFFLFTAKGGGIEDQAATAGVTGYVQKGTGTEQYDELASRIRDAV
ncbi:response regulator [Haloarculaceae archaeon H-GB2-1]|nr:response regulator [Haloarculaceae archaeon H-GB1-1]MEA5385883.1 response regulator [Haloarculaceae archaeon H-GB11]MEA5407389.1 response regulator [Haloarculaceae archaeon H-GB2-1]